MTTFAVNVERAEQRESIAWLAAEAMYREVRLTPKPGLVDGENNGAHRDMNIALFMSSIRAVSPWFPRFFAQGKATADLPAPQTLLAIRPTGLACEQAMFNATGESTPTKAAFFPSACCAPPLGALLSATRCLASAICARKPARCARAWLARN